MCMRVGALRCAEKGDGCTGGYWCEMLAAVPGMGVERAKHCMVNGDTWFCSLEKFRGRADGSTRYDSTCVAYGSDETSPNGCNDDLLFCAGKMGDVNAAKIRKSFDFVYI